MKRRGYQEEAIYSVLKELRKNKKCQLIMACGTGKTLTSKWIDADLKTKLTLVLLPSLDLIEQFSSVWNSKETNSITISSSSNDKLDKDEIKREKTVIFSTYHSVDIILRFTKENNFKFDLIVFDEAHRIATSDSGTLFKKAHSIKTKNKLFMTATPKIIASNYSMNNESLYGNIAYTYNFKDAIRDKVLSDYEIYCLGFDTLMANHRYNPNVSEIFLQAESIKNLYKEKKAKKMVVFSNKRVTAKSIQGFFKKTSKIKSFYIDGNMSQDQRRRVLEKFKNTEEAVIFNAKCLIEGIDDSGIDSVYFVNDKKSEIEAIQAASRALRFKKKKKAKIFIPIFSMKHIAGDIENIKVITNIIKAFEDGDISVIIKGLWRNGEKKRETSKIKSIDIPKRKFDNFIMERLVKKYFSFEWKYNTFKKYIQQFPKDDIKFPKKEEFEGLRISRFKQTLQDRYKDNRISKEQFLELKNLGFDLSVKKNHERVNLLEADIVSIRVLNKLGLTRNEILKILELHIPSSSFSDIKNEKSYKEYLTSELYPIIEKKFSNILPETKNGGKYTSSTIMKLRKLHSEGLSRKEIESQLNISFLKSTFSQIVNYKQYKTIFPTREIGIKILNERKEENSKMVKGEKAHCSYCGKNYTKSKQNHFYCESPCKDSFNNYTNDERWERMMKSRKI